MLINVNGCNRLVDPRSQRSEYIKYTCKRFFFEVLSLAFFSCLCVVYDFYVQIIPYVSVLYSLFPPDFRTYWVNTFLHKDLTSTFPPFSDTVFIDRLLNRRSSLTLGTVRTH